MDSRDLGILAVVVIGGLAIGWASGEHAVTPSHGEGTSAPAADSSSAPSQFGGAAASEGAVMPSLASRTSEGEQIDSAVQARAQAAFQSGMAETAAGAAPADLPVMPPPPPAQSGSNWAGQSAASGSGWGGQGQGSGGGWGVQAGVAPASPTPTPTPPASPSAASDQQPTG